MVVVPLKLGYPKIIEFFSPLKGPGCVSQNQYRFVLTFPPESCFPGIDPCLPGGRGRDFHGCLRRLLGRKDIYP